jgi:hypothetical protein
MSEANSGVRYVSEIYGSSRDHGDTGGDHYDHVGNDHSDPWENYDPEAELERLGITRAGERERAMAAWERQRDGDADDQADHAQEQDQDAWGYDDSGKYQETSAEVQARIASQDQLPTPEKESRQATWGDHPVYHDETNLDDADGDALAQRAGGDDPLTGLDQTAASAGLPRQADSDAETGEDHQPVDVASEAEAALRQQVAELKTENAQLGKDMAELKAENADIRSKNAELERGYSALETRIERLEKSSPDKPAASISGMELGTPEISQSETKQPSARQEWTSNEAFALAASTGGGILTTVSDYWSYLPATYAGITASILGVGAAAVALIRKHREAKDATHRPGH